MKNLPRVKVTDDAKKVINELRAKYGELMFPRSGDCCDGSSLMCYADYILFIYELTAFVLFRRC